MLKRGEKQVFSTQYRPKITGWEGAKTILGKRLYLKTNLWRVIAQTKLPNLPMKKAYTFCCLCWCLYISASYQAPIQAQDPHFSQFYASPLYLNPALTGTADEGRMLFNYRAQWVSLPGEFASYTVSYDHNFHHSGSNLGVLASFDKAGSAGVRSINLGLLYAYTLKVGDQAAVNVGMQAAYGNRTLNYLQLVFGDQLSALGVINQDSQENFADLSLHYFDLSAGAVFYTPQFWFGVSAAHLNQPRYGLGTRADFLPMRISAQMGYKIYFDSYGPDDQAFSLHPMVYYARQGDMQQLDLAANLSLSPVLMGLGYRGVPIGGQGWSAAVITGGFRYQDFAFLYSYDFPVGRLARATGGAHELTLRLDLNYPHGSSMSYNPRKRKKGRVAFPSF